MKKALVLLSLVATVALWSSGCDEPHQTSDEIQRKEQETILAEGTAQVGMPAVKNFRERKLMKDIIEMRDQEGLVTCTYLENAYPNIVRGVTALGGKLTFLGESIGYGIPYATQFTNPEKIGRESGHWGVVLPQADPNGLFSPQSAEGTWVLLNNPESGDAEVVYVEPRIVTLPFKLKFD